MCGVYLYFVAAFIPAELGYNCFVGKSIYIAIPCLGVDKELPKTIDWCLQKQSGENEIKIHVAMTDRKDYYDHVSELFSKVSNVSFSYYDLKDNFGVGKARYNASSQYNNEDYFLQIDSHMLFHDNWDSILIERFETAKKTLNHDKIVLSCNLGSYWYKNAELINYDKEIFYSTYQNDSIILGFKNVPLSFYDLPENISYELFEQINTTGFAPLNKICAHMIFSDKHFFLNRGLNEEFLFWEEESLQSIELLSNGFYLVFPKMPSIMNHKIEETLCLPEANDLYRKDGFYSRENPSRENNHFYLERINVSPDIWVKTIDENYEKYIKDNPDKIEAYKRYCGIDISSRHFSDFCYPKSYNFNLK